LAGSGEPGASDGIGTSTEFYYPFHLAISSDGSVVYVADKVSCFVVGKHILSGEQAYPNYPIFPLIAILCQNNHRIRMIDTESSLVSTLAGSSEGFADGIGTSAKFDYPRRFT
jgi:DNA-binding beta-propeller fold protein YncE